MRIPNYVIKGATAQLECLYDLDGEALYSVKWYKDGSEFYRYLPRDSPPGQSFRLPGVAVDVSILYNTPKLGAACIVCLRALKLNIKTTLHTLWRSQTMQPLSRSRSESQSRSLSPFRFPNSVCVCVSCGVSFTKQYFK